MLNTTTPRKYRVFFSDGTMFDETSYDVMDAVCSACLSFSHNNPGLDTPLVKGVKAIQDETISGKVNQFFESILTKKEKE